uniref:Uncharacterized protein n=1 Tax=Ficedula albicollis TaxID=59894 RepID=A0A803W1Q5_FICAL
KSLFSLITTDEFLSPGGFSAALLWSLLSPPFTVPLLLSLQSHTYVNTATGQREPRGRHCVHSLPEAHPPFPPRNHSCSLEDRNPQVFLQPGEVKFVLAPSSGYRRLCRHPRESHKTQTDFYIFPPKTFPTSKIRFFPHQPLMSSSLLVVSQLL